MHVQLCGIEWYRLAKWWKYSIIYLFFNLGKDSLLQVVKEFWSFGVLMKALFQTKRALILADILWPQIISKLESRCGLAIN